ncbi:MAG TPA: DUF4124 domain-containing protein [Telluria sp.]|nr:DUF4124 domain-containing protein [Telluria sp.]
MIRKTRLACATALALALPVAAQAQIYRCVDAAGHKEYTDQNKPGCAPLDLPGGAVSTVAPIRARDVARKPAAMASSPADFPRVATAEQRARDDDRRAILNDELREEEKKLGALKAEYNNGEPERQGNEKNYAKYQERVAQLRENISRSEKNIEAIKREISNIK